jgi:predicted nuclease with TOPRIM domain
VQDLKAMLAQTSAEHREYFEKIMRQQDKILEFKSDLESIRNALPNKEADTLKKIEEQVDRFTRWEQLGEVVAKLWQIGFQYVSSNPEAFRKIGWAITRLIFGG